MDEFLLFSIVLATSSLTSAVGIGGGLILIGILPNFLTPQAVIPAHALTQLSSNASRAWLNLNVINRRWFWQFVLGAVIAMLVLWPFISTISGEHFPLFIAFYLLASQWLPQFDQYFKALNNVYFIGFIQTSLGFFVGATGPMAMGFMSRRGLLRDEMIATTAAFMVVTHISKLIVFSRFSAQLLDVWSSLIAMVAAAILGSWLGKKVRTKISEKYFKLLLKYLLSALALHLLGRYFGFY